MTAPDTCENQPANDTVELEAPAAAVRTVGRYKLIEKIGAGGMGEIYLAEDPSLNRRVALKLLPERFTQDPGRVRRFEQEAKAASGLNHPNIITIFEIGAADDLHYIATEYIEGQTLRGQMAERLTINAALNVAIQMASALKTAHEAGIIHRDIKPENVMVRPDGLVKLLDFGIAKLVEKHANAIGDERIGNAAPDQYVNDRESEDATADESLNQTPLGVIFGTVSYMPPEQLRETKVDERADIFSLGVVLYEVIAGTPPFKGSTQMDIITAILDGEPAPLSKSRPETPTDLEEIVAKALKKDRYLRYQHIEELLNDLTALKQELEFQAKLEQTTGQIRTESSGVGRTTDFAGSRFTGHKRRSMILVAIVTAAALAYLGYVRFALNAGSGISSIAVLPLKNLSNDPEKEYLSDGISESLINRLSQLPGLKVIAYNSSSRYKNTDTEPREVARALQTSALVTGKLQQQGNRLAISVELVDGRDSRQLWGERYNREATDLASLEAEISGEIAERLRLRLSSDQQHQLSGRKTINPEAYELLLKGRFYRSRGKMEDRKKAADYFTQAISIDPNFASPYAELSDIYRSLVGSSVLDPRQYLFKAEQASSKAIELDESLADAHYASANLKTYAWLWEDAEREYKRAIELSPNLALAHRWYASFLRLMGRHEQAIAEIKLARDLDPISPGINATVGYIFFSARQYDQALNVLKDNLELDRNYPYTHLFLGFTYAAKEMYPEALAAYQKAINLGLDTPSTRIFFGVAYAQSGDILQAQAILKKLQTNKEYVSPAELATLCMSLGDREQAIALLEKAYEARDSQLQYLGVNPGYDSLRSDPRFQDLLRRIGLIS